MDNSPQTAKDVDAKRVELKALEKKYDHKVSNTFKKMFN